ncbi:Bax inhibitor-1/YccA family membrane protein [Corynebacterium otitidis]
MHSGNPIMGRLAGAERYAVRDENQEGYQGFGNPAEPAAPAAALQERDRPLTVDDVVITTGIALAVIVAAAVGGFGLSTAIGDERVAAAIGLISAIGGLITVCAWSSRGSHGSPAATITFAVFEGFLVGSFSMALLGEVDGIPDSGVIITQAVVGTIGVFAGTLVVYKASPKDVDAVGCLFQFLVPFIAGLAAIVLVNAVASLISGGELVPFDGGEVGIVFALVCIFGATVSFQVEFEVIEQLVRAQAPAREAWALALGLSVTLVWLYIEILIFFAHLTRDDD